ncbi:MAG: 50S ribosomal protein L6 [Coxiella sp. DG_40]|nr:MAG: 50S ribosomal protein L6 [Coxiella sp. DG_40]
MSKIAKNPIVIPSDLEVTVNGKIVTIKSHKATLTEQVNDAVEITKKENMLQVSPVKGVESANVFAGTTRSLINNMVIGLKEGFEKKLILVGVGYRTQVQGKKLMLSLGFSHPVSYKIPESITVETPSPTEIVIKGVNKRLVGQVAADIRAFRPPEPYKGKGVRYSDEEVVRKVGKKK